MHTDHTLVNYNLIFSGKVRDVYDYEQEKLLIITTDRISAFDFVFDDEIEGKGIILNKMSKFWFILSNHLIKNHFLDIKPDIPEEFRNRVMVVKKTKVLPIEAIVRGHVTGSAWKEYKKSKTIHGESIKQNISEHGKLTEPLFTPSTKAEIGNKDENINFDRMKELVGLELAKKIKEVSLKLYNFAYKYAKKRGVIIADTKFEFGLDYNNELILIDEIFTPDCSRFWLINKKGDIDYSAFDKQFFRDYLISQNWKNNQIKIPIDIKQKLINKYKTALNLITKNDSKKS
jgi:phosphoribosylaminoimidazole-succinocarboxamide synthase